MSNKTYSVKIMRQTGSTECTSPETAITRMKQLKEENKAYKVFNENGGEYILINDGLLGLKS